MSHGHAIWSALCLVLTTAGVTAPSPSDADDRLEAAIGSEDLASVRSLLDEEVQLLPEFDKALLGRDAALGYYGALFRRFDVQSYDRRTEEVFDMGPLLVEIGSFTLQIAEGDQSRSLEGSFFDVWRQGGAGTRHLVSQAWNFRQPYEGLREWIAMNQPEGVHLAFTAGTVVDAGTSLDASALHTLSDYAMLRGQVDLLHHMYAEDAVMIPHDGPPVRGRQNIRSYMEGYGGSWPPFAFVKSTGHSLHEHEGLVLETLSYTLRWDSLDASGIGIGKGVRLLKRDDRGSLRIYRSIAMHDQ